MQMEIFRYLVPAGQNASDQSKGSPQKCNNISNPD